MPSKIHENQSAPLLSQLMHKLGALAQERAELSTTEARLWAELGRLLRDTSLQHNVDPRIERGTAVAEIDTATLLPVP